MKKMILFFSLFLCFLGCAFAQTNTIEQNPVGQYCGKVMHAGDMVKMVLILSKDENGTLVGKSYYDDDNKDRNTVILTMRETGRPSNTTINFIWEDVYGKGLASLVFNEDYSDFTGTWGTGLEKPFLPWLGRKCDDKTS